MSLVPASSPHARPLCKANLGSLLKNRTSQLAVRTKIIGARLAASIPSGSMDPQISRVLPKLPGLG